MTKGRKPGASPEPIATDLDQAELQRKNAALTEVQTRSAEVAERFGDGTPYERARIVSEARFFMAQSAEAMLELGKRLIQIKENEPHGEFVEIVEQRLGMNVRSAQKMMQAAVKYLAPTLMAKASAPTLLGLGKAKLLELMAEPDDEIEALAAGGTVAGMTLDDIVSMSSRELRTALLEARQAIAAKDKVIGKKDAKLNKLAEEAELRRALGSDEAGALTQVRDATVAAEIALAQLGGLIGEVLSAAPSEAAATAARQAGEYVGQRVVDLLRMHGITVDLDQPIDLGLAAGGKPSRKAGRAAS